jgi:hypothetical protein
MKLSEIKRHLAAVQTVEFALPSGEFVPAHYHVTEIGIITKNFIDCGGKVRNEKVANFQLWTADDIAHRLRSQKLINIISLSEKVLAMEDLEIEVEYQTDTIGKYGLYFNGKNFELTQKVTMCLAQDNCNIPNPKNQFDKIEVVKQNTCTPDSKCC